MKIFFDVNVVVDIIGRAISYPESLWSYDVAMIRKYDVFIASSSTPTIDYVLGNFASTNLMDKNIMHAILGLFDVADVTESDCKLASESKMPDYEDALIAESAARHGADLIITRDKKGFKESPVKAITPTDFFKTFKPNNYNYELIEF